METIDRAKVRLDQCDAPVGAERRLAMEILDHIADKWTGWVIQAVGASGQLRCSRLLERVEGVSQKLRTKTMRGLERDGLVTRTMYMEVRPRVEYELSPTGQELLLQVRLLWRWGVENVDGFQAARDRFDSLLAKKAWAIINAIHP